MYIHFDLMEKDMLDPHISFHPMKRFMYTSQLPANQKLRIVAIIHHYSWIRCGSVLISCASLSDSLKTIFGVSIAGGAWWLSG